MLIASITALSRLTGFARTWAMALALGAGVIASAYNVSNNIPNLIFELVAGGVLGSLFIPTFTEIRTRLGEDEAWRFTSHVFNLCLLGLGAVALIGILLPEPFIWTQTFRMDAESASTVREPAAFLFRFFAIQVVLYGASLVAQGVLNAQRKFLWPALGPVFNNLVVIAALLIVAMRPALDTTALVILGVGTTLGVAMQFLVQAPSLRRAGFRYVPELGLRSPHVHTILRLAGPAILFAFTNMVTLSVRNASVLAVSPQGASVVMYAWMWFTLPYGILVVALSTATFTELAHARAADNMDAFKRALSRGLAATVGLIVPSAIVLAIFAEPICSLFVGGRFTPEDKYLVAEVLRTWAFGLTFYALMMFLLGSFYALKDTKTPAIANGIASIGQVAGYLMLTTGFGAWSGFGLRGAPIADSIFYLVMTITFVVLLRRKIGALDFWHHLTKRT